MKFAALVFSLLLVFVTDALADNYRVTTLRASPGFLEPLLEEVVAYRAAQGGRVIVMRHSQGDHWDLMLLEPAKVKPTATRDFGELVNFQHSFLAASQAKFEELANLALGRDLYHVEMFHALAGKHAALLDQRERENQYLEATGQTSNHIFVTHFGSDVDVFTLGFHEDWKAFIAGPTVTDAQAELAARNAGFRNRADLGFYLRSLLTHHQDTLAVPVR